jgi:hypothetical protein
MHPKNISLDIRIKGYPQISWEILGYPRISFWGEHPDGEKMVYAPKLVYISSVYDSMQFTFFIGDFNKLT